MSQPGIVGYLRQNLLVALLRLVASHATFFPIRHDARRAKSIYPHIKTSLVHIPSRDEGRSIQAHLYHPSPASLPTSPDSPRPVLVNWHGSGFITPLLGTDAFYCAQIAHEAGILVLDADYRKSPETRFPGAIHDVEDVLNWISTQPRRFDCRRVAVSGFSAGGNLALVAASTLRKTLQVDIKAAMAMYPMTDLSILSETKMAPKPVNPIPPFMMDMFCDCYVPEKAMRSDPKVSPAYANASEFPSTVVIVTSDGDILGPEADSLAQKLNDGMRRVMHVQVKGCRSRI